jgi:flagellar motor protein MotB
VRRRHATELFPVNVWPPFVDALTLVLAAFVLLMVTAALAQRGLLLKLRSGESELQKLRDEKGRIERRLKSLASTGSIEVEEGKVILQGEVLFASGSDELSARGEDTLANMAGPLAQLTAAEPDQMILVGGHTDDVPIANQRFQSNWELSAARATQVAHALIAAGLPADRVVASGFGSHHPRAANESAEGRQRNRRIEVLVVPIRAVSSR